MRISAQVRGRLITVLLTLAVGLACYAIARTDPWGEKGSGLPAVFSLDLKNLIRIDPALIRYQQTGEFAVPLEVVRALAAGPANRVLVAGDRQVQAFSMDGRLEFSIPLSGEPSCLAVGPPDHVFPGRIYVAVERRIEFFAADGRPVGSWDVGNSKTQLTSLAVAKQDLFLADAGNRVVLRWDAEGRQTGTIGAPDPERDMPGFLVPSRYFDIAVDADELVHIANPGRLRIEAFSFDGQLQSYWGAASPAVSDFFGCCNPSQFAVLPTGQFVTSEKGIPRVKVYRPSGEFECVVAGPEQLGVAEGEIGDPRADAGGAVFDVAAGADGTILVLDPKTRRVRLFRLRDSQPAQETR